MKPGLLYSSSWNGTKTKLQLLAAGNVQVRTTAIASKPANIVREPGVEIEPITVTAYPNPTTQYFNVKLKSNVTEKVQIKVFDASGRPAYVTEGSSDQTYRFGVNFPSGTYFLSVKKGGKVQIVKLIKLK